MQCVFDIKSLFYGDIIKIRADLLPLGFNGSPKECMDARERIAYIIDRLGQLSSTAQSLNTPITSAKKIVNNQVIYLLSTMDKGNKMVVSGLLKMGPKDLYLYDEDGELYRCIATPAILDFYVHCSQQRQGLGKRLIDYMLKDLGTSICKCAVDRPSKSMMPFLAKNYNLKHSIAQTNNYTVFQGFFDGKDSTKVKSSELKSKSKESLVSGQLPHLRESLPHDSEMQVRPPKLQETQEVRTVQQPPEVRKKERVDKTHEELSMAEIMEIERNKRELVKPTSFRRTKNTANMYMNH